MVWTENTLYEAAVCLLKDITSLGASVSRTEPRAFRLSERQTRDGERIDSNAAEGQTRQQQPTQTAGESSARRQKKNFQSI